MHASAFVPLNSFKQPDLTDNAQNPGKRRVHALYRSLVFGAAPDTYCRCTQHVSAETGARYTYGLLPHQATSYLIPACAFFTKCPLTDLFHVFDIANIVTTLSLQPSGPAVCVAQQKWQQPTHVLPKLLLSNKPNLSLLGKGQTSRPCVYTPSPLARVKGPILCKIAPFFTGSGSHSKIVRESHMKDVRVLLTMRHRSICS